MSSWNSNPRIETPRSWVKDALIPLPIPHAPLGFVLRSCGLRLGLHASYIATRTALAVTVPVVRTLVTHSHYAGTQGDWTEYERTWTIITAIYRWRVNLCERLARIESQL